MITVQSDLGKSLKHLDSSLVSEDPYICIRLGYELGIINEWLKNNEDSFQCNIDFRNRKNIEWLCIEHNRHYKVSCTGSLKQYLMKLEVEALIKFKDLEVGDHFLNKEKKEFMKIKMVQPNIIVQGSYDTKNAIDMNGNFISYSPHYCVIKIN